MYIDVQSSWRRGYAAKSSYRKQFALGLSLTMLIQYPLPNHKLIRFGQYLEPFSYIFIKSICCKYT